MKLIDKDALVAEINRIVDVLEKNGDVQMAVCKKFLSFLNTLDVKEVPVSKDLEDAINQSFIYHENHGDDFRSDKQIETAYRYGFESGFKYKESTSIIEDIEKQNLEMKEVDLDKKIKDYFDSQPIITRSKGVDYRLIPSAEDIAKHFFELGLKAQKGE